MEREFNPYEKVKASYAFEHCLPSSRKLLRFKYFKIYRGEDTKKYFYMESS